MNYYYFRYFDGSASVWLKFFTIIFRILTHFPPADTYESNVSFKDVSRFFELQYFKSVITLKRFKKGAL